MALHLVLVQGYMAHNSGARFQTIAKPAKRMWMWMFPSHPTDHAQWFGVYLIV